MAIQGRGTEIWTSVPNNTVFLDKTYSALLAALAVEQTLVESSNPSDGDDRYAHYDQEDYAQLVKSAADSKWKGTKKHLRQLLIAHRKIVCILPKKTNFGPDFSTRVAIWKLLDMGLIDGVIEEEGFRVLRSWFPMDIGDIHDQKLKVINSALNELPLSTALIIEYFFPKMISFFPKKERITLDRAFDYEHIPSGLACFMLLNSASVQFFLRDWWKHKRMGDPELAAKSEQEVFQIESVADFAAMLRSGPAGFETEWGKQFLIFLKDHGQEVALAREWLASVDWSPPFSKFDFTSFIDEFGSLIDGYAAAGGMKFLTSQELYFSTKITKKLRRRSNLEPKAFSQRAMVGAGICIGPDWEIPSDQTDIRSLLDLRRSNSFDLVKSGIELVFEQLALGDSIDVAIVKDAIHQVCVQSEKGKAPLGRFINYAGIPSFIVDTIVQAPITGLILGTVSTVSQASEDFGRAGSWNISVTPL
jgi:hypothetical protein